MINHRTTIPIRLERVDELQARLLVFRCVQIGKHYIKHVVVMFPWLVVDVQEDDSFVKNNSDLAPLALIILLVEQCNKYSELF